jgi:cytochrome c oxidase subunit 1
MPRRTFTYDGTMGWNSANFIATVGAFILGIGIAIYFAIMIYTLRKGEKVRRDPWDGRTLEWSLPTPPREYNYAVIPTVHARDAFWYEKHHREEIARENTEHAKAEEAHGGIHMPFQSVWPLVTSIGILIGGFAASGLDSNPEPGIHLKLGLTIFGGLIMLFGIYMWALEGSDGYHIHLDKDGNILEDGAPAKH